MSPGYYLEPELYDLVYADVVADIEPWVAEAGRVDGRMLELCCGTGRLLAPTLAAGVRCDGMDLEPAMLERCRTKLEERGQHTTLGQGDMRAFALPHRYTRIAVGFNSFLHNLTQQDQLATLRCCRAHLENGGSLQIVAFHPSVEGLLKWSGRETLAKEIPWGGTPDRLRLLDTASDDRVEQVRHMTRRIQRLAPDGAVREEHVLTFDLRYIYKPEMELLLRVAGFPRWAVRPLFADYTDPATARTPDAAPREGDNLLWTAWKD